MFNHTHNIKSILFGKASIRTNTNHQTPSRHCQTPLHILARPMAAAAICSCVTDTHSITTAIGSSAETTPGYTEQMLDPIALLIDQIQV
jgi:hypothetical protein